MNSSNGTTSVSNENVNAPEAQSELKGKGKAVDYATQEMSMDEDEDSSDEDDGVEEEVFDPSTFFLSSNTHFYFQAAEPGKAFSSVALKATH